MKQLGLWGLFTRGLPLRIVMIGTLTGAQWGIYDAFKVSLGCKFPLLNLACILIGSYILMENHVMSRPTTGGVAPAPAAAKAATELA